MAMGALATGNDLFSMGRFEEAVAALEMARDMFHAEGHWVGEANALHGSSAALMKLGRLEEGRDCCQQALEIYRKLRALQFVAPVTADLGALDRALGQFDEAIEHYEDAIRLYETLGDAGEIERSRVKIAEIRDERARQVVADAAAVMEAPGDALPKLERALSDVRGQGKPGAEAVVLQSLAAAYVQLGRPAEAVACLKEAIELFTEAGWEDRAAALEEPLAVTLKRVVIEAFDRGELKRGLEAVEEAIAAFRKVGDSPGEATTLQARGSFLQRAGRPREALPDLMAARELLAGLRERGADGATLESIRRGEGVTLNAIGAVHKDLGRFEEALSYCEQALQIRRENGDLAGEAVTLNDLGIIQSRLGDHEEARRYLERAVAIATESGNRRHAAVVRQSLGTEYWRLGLFEQALECFTASLEVHRELGNRRFEGWALYYLGELPVAVFADPAEPARIREEALAAFREVGDSSGEAAALKAIGAAHVDAGDFEAGISPLEAALAILQAVGDRPSEVQVHTGLGIAHRDLGHARQAREHLEEAIVVVEGLRGELLSEELRTSWFASVAEIYGTYVSLLVEQGEPEQAFAAAQRGRARAFLDLLAEAQGEVREGVDPALHEEEQRLHTELGALHRRRVAARSLPEEQRDSELIAELDGDVQECELALRNLEARIRSENPRYAALTQPVAWELAEIQMKLVDERTALLEYVLGDRGSLLFCVLKDRFEVFSLPPRDEIETMVRELRAAVTYGMRRYPHGHELFRALIAPVAELVAGKDLLICADGALHYLPFALLLTEPPEGGDGEAGGDPAGVRRRGAAAGDEERALRAKVEVDVASLPPFDYSHLPYLLRRHALRYAPSATVAGMVHEEARARSLAYEADLAALADPQGLGDGDVPVNLGAALAHVQERLEPIPQTAEEVAALAKLFPAERVALRTGRAATKDEAVVLISGERAFRFFHIASHGLLDPEKPEFSGLLFTRANGGDPFWRTFEIFNARVPSELVVLSACETGLGKIVSGEGVVGLTRAFFYAGALSVCVSLWKVADASTPPLMEAFYRAILTGTPKAEALRQAQLQLLDESPYVHPFWWAPFVLVG